MKMKLTLLFIGFIACYFIMHVAYDLPGLLNGNPRFAKVPDSSSAMLSRLADVLVTFLFALIPYLIQYYLYPNKNIFAALVLTILCLPLIFILHYWIVLMTGPHYRLRSFFLDNIFYSSIFVIYGLVFYFIRYSYYKELQQKELVIQNRQSELSFLRSQINPHFLFNSLNNIYSLAYKHSDKVLPAISGLSDLLRYMLYDTTEKVPLQKELDYVQKYIALQKLRFDQPVQVNLHVAGDINLVLIPPLLLIPFIENAFKHGDVSAGDGPVINIYTGGNKLHVHCHNKKGQQQKDSGGGIGLENVKRRLSLLYPDKHLLLIEDKKDAFTVNLELVYA